MYEPVKLWKLAKGMNFWIQNLETLYYISSEQQKTDQPTPAEAQLINVACD